MSERSDIEIYVENASIARIEEWLESIFGAVLSKVQHEDADITIYTVARGDDTIAVTVTPDMDFPQRQGSYTSVYFASSKTPWRDDVECAGEAIGFFGTEILCDPARPELRNPFEWLKVTLDGESLTSENTP